MILKRKKTKNDFVVEKFGKTTLRRRRRTTTTVTIKPENKK